MSASQCRGTDRTLEPKAGKSQTNPSLSIWMQIRALLVICRLCPNVDSTEPSTVTRGTLTANLFRRMEMRLCGRRNAYTSYRIENRVRPGDERVPRFFIRR
jgi:hypothetical protein